MLIKHSITHSQFLPRTKSVRRPWRKKKHTSLIHSLGGYPTHSEFLKMPRLDAYPSSYKEQHSCTSEQCARMLSSWRVFVWEREYKKGRMRKCTTFISIWKMTKALKLATVFTHIHQLKQKAVEKQNYYNSQQ